MRRLVILESPYSAVTADERALNLAYARLAMLDSLNRDEAPMVSHLLYTQVLRDGVKQERWAGIEAGLAWGRVADATVVYCDRGISDGMLTGIARAQWAGRTVERRYILENGHNDRAETKGT